MNHFLRHTQHMLQELEPQHMKDAHPQRWQTLWVILILVRLPKHIQMRVGDPFSSSLQEATTSWYQLP